MALAVQQGNHQGPLLIAVVQAADQVGPFVAVQHGHEQLHRQLRVLANPVGQAVAHLRFQPCQVTLQVTVGDIERVVGEDRLQHSLQATAQRIGTGLRGALAPAQRRPGGVDEHATIADLVVAEQAAEQRVVPGLGQLIVQPGVDLLNVGVFGQRPLRHVQQHRRGEGLAQPAVDLGDFFFIQADARSRGLLDFLPARLFEALAGAEGDALEVVTVIVEARQDGAGDFDSGPGLGHAGHLMGE